MSDTVLAEPSKLEIEQRWVAEAARRYRELKAGRAQTIASEEVFRKLETRRRS